MTAKMNQQDSSEKTFAASVLPGSFWCLCCCESLRLCAFILNDNSKSSLSWLVSPRLAEGT